MPLDGWNRGEDSKNRNIAGYLDLISNLSRALNYARLKAAPYGSLVENTKALAFFSTPHMGASPASWLSFLTGLTGVVKSSTNVQDLETWSHALLDLSTTFAEIADDFAITTFYEKFQTYGVQVSFLPCKSE